jgi:hypothetical protein
VDIDLKTKLKKRVWPLSFTLHPSYLMLGAAVVATGLSGTAVLGNGVKAIRWFTTVGSLITLVVSLIAVVLWILATVCFKVWDTGNKYRYDLW